MGKKKSRFSGTFIKPVLGKAGIRPSKLKGLKDLTKKQIQSRLNATNKQLATIKKNIANFESKKDRTSMVKALLSERVKDTLESKKAWLNKTIKNMNAGIYEKGRLFIVQRYDKALKHQRDVIKFNKKTFEAKNKDINAKNFKYLLERHSDLFYSEDNVVKGLETIINREGKYHDLTEWDIRLKGHTLSEFADWLQSTHDGNQLFQSFYDYGTGETKINQGGVNEFEGYLDDFLYDIKRGLWPLK